VCQMKIKIELEIDTESQSDMEAMDDLIEIIERLKQGE
jgi:hypothetical protein